MPIQYSYFLISPFQGCTALLIRVLFYKVCNFILEIKHSKVWKNLPKTTEKHPNPIKQQQQNKDRARTGLETLWKSGQSLESALILWDHIIQIHKFLQNLCGFHSLWQFCSVLSLVHNNDKELLDFVLQLHMVGVFFS